MSEQTRGTTTNMTKLVAWNNDIYNLMPDDDGCFVCLTSRDKYVLGQALKQAYWNTRWQSQQGTAIPASRDSKVGELEEKMDISGCVDFCNEMVDCIDNSDAVNSALVNWATNNLNYLTANDNTEGLSVPISDATDCDPDEIWGNCVAVWQYINQTNIDFLEIVVAADNVIELIGDILEAIPIVNILPFDALAEFINDLSGWTLDEYNAALTVALSEDIECNLFCIALENCLLTFDDLIQYFQSYFSIDLESYQLTEMFDWFIAQTHVGEPIVYAVTCLQLLVVATANQFLGNYFPNVYATAARLGTPDNDWELLCEDCNTWSHTFNFQDSDEGWTILVGTSQLDYIINGHTSIGEGNVADLQIKIAFPTRVLTSIVTSVYFTSDRTTANPEFYIFDGTDPYTHIITSQDVTTFDEVIDLGWSGEESASGLRVRLISRPGSENRLYTIVIQGNGTDPFA